jgi:hypothetical protein
MQINRGTIWTRSLIISYQRVALVMLLSLLYFTWSITAGRSVKELGVTPSFKFKIRCSSYICLGLSCHTYGQNVNPENQYLYYIISYYKSKMTPSCHRQMTGGFTRLKEVFIKVFLIF